jgi:hypothetical protein
MDTKDIDRALAKEWREGYQTQLVRFPHQDGCFACDDLEGPFVVEAFVRRLKLTKLTLWTFVTLCPKCKKDPDVEQAVTLNMITRYRMEDEK